MIIVGTFQLTKIRKWMRLCFSRDVMRRALLTAMVVGTILAGINHGDALLHGSMTPGRVSSMLLTYLVPYCVSTYSSVSAILSIKQDLSR